MARRPGGAGPSGVLPDGFSDVHLIGTGSSASVYRARESGTNRFVAVKVFDVAESFTSGLAAFQRAVADAPAVATDRHIVNTYGVITAPDGRPGLVLELCRGAVSNWVPPGTALPAPQTVTVALALASALDTVHAAGLVHGRVTPQNVMVNSRTAPALGDLGEAFLRRAGLLGAGLFDFTSLHAAPELLEGGEVTPATDVYALASTMYQLMAGHPAFRAFDGESPASVSLRILRDPVPALIIAGVPVELSDLIQWGMAKDPATRPPSAAMFASYLTRIQDGFGRAT